jgi:hypothetical protein
MTPHILVSALRGNRFLRNVRIYVPKYCVPFHKLFLAFRVNFGSIVHGLLYVLLYTSQGDFLKRLRVVAVQTAWILLSSLPKKA